MNTENTDKQLATKPVRELRVVEDQGPLSYLFDTARFEHMFRIAGAMAAASLIPEHLWRNKTEIFQPEVIKSNCFLIVNQAIRWGMDPFAVMPETYVVGGKLGYQGKLVTAVINARAGLKERLRFTHSGKKGTDDYTVTVSGQFPDEAEPRIVTLSVGEAKTGNDMWRKDPEQKLCYSGAVKWARRHAPEIILGILTDDDLERIDASTKLRDSEPAGVRSVDSFVMPTRPAIQDTTEAPKHEVAGQTPEQVTTQFVADMTTKETSREDDIRNSLLLKLSGAKEKAKVDDHQFLQAVVEFCTNLDPAAVHSIQDIPTDTLDAVAENIEEIIERAKQIKPRKK